MTQVNGVEVRFTGDTSGLERSVSRAESVISGFAKNALAGLAGALTVGAFVRAGQAALNFADDIGKMAQKVGMSTAELSKLSYAAKLSDVSLQELQVGVGLLSKNMETGSEGLAALGISATDASGNLRSTAEVFADVAEAFSQMEDGAGKTAIAMNIFGRSGANMIPLLNSGRKGLREMGDEAQKLGVVISDGAAKSAERFNDNLTRLQEGMSGVVQEVMRQLLPHLIKLTEKLLDLIKTGPPLGQYIQNVIGFFAELKPFIEATRKEVDLIVKALEYLGVIAKAPLEINIPGGDLQVGEPQGPPKPPKKKPPRLDTGDKPKDDTQDMRVPGVAGVDAVDSFFIERLAAIQEGFKTEQEFLMEEYAAQQDVLQGALNNKLISEQEYYDLSTKLAQEHQASLAQIQAARLDGDLAAASAFFGSMAQAAQSGGKKMIKVAKAIGAAQAVIDTIRAAVSAMNDPTAITPLQKFANYAMVFAKGMSAVAAIKSVSDNGGGGGGGGGRGGGGGGGAAEAAPRSGGPTTTFQFTLMNDPMGFGEKFARQFIDQLNSTQRNGGQIRGVIA